jgi:hypothetical protein
VFSGAAYTSWNGGVYITPTWLYAWDINALVTDNLQASGTILNLTGGSGGVSIDGKLSLSVPPTMTYTTMIESTSTQVGYIITAKSTLTTVLTTSLSGYICYFQLPIGVYQFNCNISIPSSVSDATIYASLYKDNIEIHGVNTPTTKLFNSLTFSFAYSNFSNTTFGIKCSCAPGNTNIAGAFIQAIRIA